MSGPNWLSSLNLDYEDAPAAHIPESTGDDADWMNSLQAWTTFDDHHFVGSNNNNNSTATTSSSSSFFPPTKNQLEQQQQHSEKIFENVFAAAGGTQPAPTAAPHALPSAYATLGTAIDGSNLVLDPTYPTSFAPAAADGSFNNSNNPARSHAPAATNADSASFGSSSSLNKKSILAATPADAFAEAQQSKKSKISSNTGFTPAAVSISPLDAAVTGGSPSQGPTISSPANSVASSTATPSAASASAVAPKPRGGQNKKIKLPKNADQLDPEDLANRMAMEEDKRRRNTAASARFRVKKKEREAAVADQNKELVAKVKHLESQVSALQEENTWLKELIEQRHGGGGSSAAAAAAAFRGTKRSANEAAL